MGSTPYEDLEEANALLTEANETLSTANDGLQDDLAAAEAEERIVREELRGVQSLLDEYRKALEAIERAIPASI